MTHADAYAHTCSEPDHCSGDDEDVTRHSSLYSTTVAVEETKQHVDDHGNEQWLSSGSLVSPEAKQRRGHKLPKAVRGHHPAEEEWAGIVVVNLWDRAMQVQ